MRTVQVTLPDNSYQILIGSGLLTDAGSHIRGLEQTGLLDFAGNDVGAKQIVVVTDANVAGQHIGVLGNSLREAELSFATTTLPAGESSKTLSGMDHVYGEFAAANLGRDGLVLAFGGGVIGDLAGFAAATWMRGVNYVQIPTSLLAQVDSSVGGKTAIDLPSGKNLAGAFWQPRLVLADTSLLSTLPRREFACGMAEVIKYGAIKSKGFFEQLASPATAPAIAEIVKICCSIKRDVVQNDQFDHGERALLNFGHTFGHAIETLGEYSEHNHGEAVAIGMVLAVRLGEKLGITKTGCSALLEQTLTEWNLPTRCPYPLEQLLPHLALDKKRQADALNMVLLRDLGQAAVVKLRLSQIGQLLEDLQ